MFRGNHPTRVDEKGRLKVPAEFKRLIDEKYGTQFYGQVVEIDGQGRLLVPAILRESAAIKGEVAVVGNLTYLEVQTIEAYRKDIAENPFTAEDEKTLDELGI